MEIDNQSEPNKMIERKKPGMIKIILWTLTGSAIFSAIFGGLIAVTSSATLFGATSFIFIALIMIFIPTFIWMDLIQPLWWDKLSDKTQENVRNWSIGLLLLSMLVLGPTGMFGGSTWSGKGEINLFPEGAASKNYRLPAEMTVNTKWWWQKEYKITSVDWPDSGTSHLVDCTISKSNDSCTDDEGRNWTIEIVETPDSSTN